MPTLHSAIDTYYNEFRATEREATAAKVATTKKKSKKPRPSRYAPIPDQTGGMLSLGNVLQQKKIGLNIKVSKDGIQINAGKDLFFAYHAMLDGSEVLFPVRQTRNFQRGGTGYNDNYRQTPIVYKLIVNPDGLAEILDMPTDMAGNAIPGEEPRVRDSGDAASMLKEYMNNYHASVKLSDEIRQQYSQRKIQDLKKARRENQD